MSPLLLLDWIRDRIHRRYWSPEMALGARGEDLAMRFLQRQKFVISARNYRPRNGKGEVDLIAWDGVTLVFVEVKTRSSDQTGSPERAVHPEKQRNLVRAAQSYTRSAGLAWDVVRFDVVSVVVSDPPQIEHFQNAFPATVAEAWRNIPYGLAPSGSYPPT